MNPDTLRSFSIRLVLLTVAVLLISQFLVRPQSLAAQDLESEYKAQMDFIDQGELEIRQHREQVEESINKLDRLRKQVLDDLRGDDSLQSHQLLQRIAGEHGLTVTRIEPLSSTTRTATTGLAEQEIGLEIRDFRIECHGAFGSVLSFVNDVQRGQRQGQVRSFRLVPVNERNVRVSLTIQLVQLVQYPPQLLDISGGSQPDQTPSEDEGGTP